MESKLARENNNFEPLKLAFNYQDYLKLPTQQLLPEPIHKALVEKQSQKNHTLFPKQIMEERK